MIEQIKKEILHSKEINDLIYSGIVDIILIGGSRILSLDSPSSDYDIIIGINTPVILNEVRFKSLKLPLFNNLCIIVIKFLLKFN